MTEPTLNRRLVLGGAALIGAAAMAADASGQPVASPAAGRAFMPKPLPMPFDPKAVPGLSQKLLVSHYDNNYTGAVKRLGAITSQFAKLDPATAPVFVVNGLKREELIAWNSMILHELYFAGLGARSRPGPALAGAIERDFGSEARWRAEFTGMGKALGGGSGWVVLTWSHRDRRLVNQWAADHSMALAGATPIMALDMYEHAYAMDYGAKAAAYVDAVMEALNWSTADAIFAKAAG